MQYGNYYFNLHLKNYLFTFVTLKFSQKLNELDMPISVFFFFGGKEPKIKI